VPSGESRDQTGALPKLYGLNVNEELGAHLGRLIIIAKHIDAMHDMSVLADQVGAVFHHRRPHWPIGLNYRRYRMMTLRKSF
jgi:hypothetical protein